MIHKAEGLSIVFVREGHWGHEILERTMTSVCNVVSLHKSVQATFQEVILGQTPSNASKIGSDPANKLMERGKRIEGF
jgi:hypothetical protein